MPSRQECRHTALPALLTVRDRHIKARVLLHSGEAPLLRYFRSLLSAPYPCRPIRPPKTTSASLSSRASVAPTRLPTFQQVAGLSPGSSVVRLLARLSLLLHVPLSMQNCQHRFKSSLRRKRQPRRASSW